MSTPPPDSPGLEVQKDSDEESAGGESDGQLELPDPGDGEGGSADGTREFLFQEFMDPVHQFVLFTERELEVIGHPAFQRLFRVYQLGQTHLVFRGATHHRGDHALGATAAAERLIAAVERSFMRDKVLTARHGARAANRSQPAPPVPVPDWKLDSPLKPCEITFFRLAVLLHDIGHVAAGHTLEDELGLLETHDSYKRLEYIFDREVWSGVNITEPTNCVPEKRTLRQLVDDLFREDAAQTGLGVPATEILFWIIAKDREAKKLAANKDVAIRMTLLEDLVGNTVCADLIDYLERDWRNIGKSKTLDPRLLEYLEIRTRVRTGESYLVVNLRSTPHGGLRKDAVSAIIELLEHRYHLWEVALLHKTKLAATAMLERAVSERADQHGLFVTTDAAGDTIEKILLNNIVETSDTEVYAALSNADWRPNPRARHKKAKSLDRESSPGQDLFWRLQHRILHKQVLAIEDHPAASETSLHLAPLDGPRQDKLEAAKRRLEGLRILELDFEAFPGAFAMHIVPFGLGKKIARVRVLYEGNVYRLDQLDDQARHALSGGHLDAQLKRSEKLWRATLFAAPEVRDSIEEAGLIGVLSQVFRRGVLGISEDGDLSRQAREVDNNERLSYTLENEFKQAPSKVARDTPQMSYPTGFLGLRAYYS